MEGGCKFIVVEASLNKCHMNKNPKEKKETVTPISGDGIQAEELANAIVLRDERT